MQHLKNEKEYEELFGFNSLKKRGKCFTNLGVGVAEFPASDAGVAVVPARAAHPSPLSLLTDLNPTDLELPDIQLNRVQPHCNICGNILKEIEESAARKKRTISVLCSKLIRYQDALLVK